MIWNGNSDGRVSQLLLHYDMAASAAYFGESVLRENRADVYTG